LTHPSFGSENNLPSYQRLEFLGDAILEFVISEYLFNKFPDKNEMFYTDQRKRLVSNEALSNIFNNYNLKEFALVGNGLIEHPKQFSNKIRSDIIESLIGAIYISTDIDTVKEFIFTIERIGN
jgi:ribonuclease-3